MEKKLYIMLFAVGGDFIAMTSVKDDMNELLGFLGKSPKEVHEKAMDYAKSNGYTVAGCEVGLTEKQLSNFILKHAGLSKRF